VHGLPAACDGDGHWAGEGRGCPVGGGGGQGGVVGDLHVPRPLAIRCCDLQPVPWSHPTSASPRGSGGGAGENFRTKKMVFTRQRVPAPSGEIVRSAKMRGHCADTRMQDRFDITLARSSGKQLKLMYILSTMD